MNDPTAMAMEEQWHKICALLLFKISDASNREVIISAAEIDQYTREHPDHVVVIRFKEREIVLQLLDAKRAEEYAQRHADGAAP